MTGSYTIIGIDPGSEDRCGYSVKTSAGLQSVASVELHELFFLIREQWAVSALLKEPLGVVLENPNLDSNVFRLGGLPRTEKEFRQAIKMASDVGKNKGVANAILTFLKSQKIRYIEIAPSARQKVTSPGADLKLMRMPTKSDAGQFKKLTGHVGSTTKDGRDAATLIYSMTFAKFEMLEKTLIGSSKK